MDFYHWRAFRYRNSLWRSHVEGVGAFLRSWHPPPNLLLVGPSGGYSLPVDWLERFHSITVIEPGFFARRILASRLHSLPAETSFRSERVAFETPGFLPDLDVSKCGVLFANVLGQIPVHEEAALRESLRQTLAGVSWASFHDRFSAGEPAWTYPDGEVPRVYTTPELIPESATRRFGRKIEVQEHLASDALSTLEPRRVRYWEWQITPRQVHLIEGMIGR